MKRRILEIKEKISNVIAGNKFLSAICTWLNENKVFVLYLLFALMIELISVWVMEGSPFMSRPFVFFGILTFLGSMVLFIPDNRIRFCVYALLLITQGVADVIFTMIFDLTGQAFVYEMLELKNDAFGTLENIPINFVTFYVGFFFCALYVVIGLRLWNKEKFQRMTWKHALFRGLATVVGGGMIAVSFVSYYPLKASDKYDEMINGTTEKNYAAYGVIGNLFGEYASSLFKDTSRKTDDEIAKFLYGGTDELNKDYLAPTTRYTGKSKDKNVVMILAESFEWFTFLGHLDRYPKAQELGLTEEKLREIFPTLWEFYDTWIVATNYHSREKTDISETLSLLGSYPTTGYINYNYQNNTLPHTVPSILGNAGGENITVRSYHNNYKTFYNRHIEHQTFGFEAGSPYDMYDMEEKANRLVKPGEKPIFTNYMRGGERNLDSEMMEICKDEMFPTDGKRFYTYITTLTMHGVYYERETLKEYREELLKYIEMPDKDDREANLLFNYLTTGMDFEKAMATMWESVDGLDGTIDDVAEDTLIVLFADHNAYYHRLSDYVKGIEDYDEIDDAETKYTDLYNIPLMIYDKDLIEAYRAENNLDEGERNIVDKYVCTADITTTVLDLLGIPYFENLYFGNSIFEEESSVLYSRAYNNFLSSGIIGSSVNNIIYQHSSVTEEALKEHKDKAKAMVEKIMFCDYIFRQDYFGNANNLNKYNDMMAAAQKAE